jgi:hypothetical protein
MESVMSGKKFQVMTLPETLAICRLEKNTRFPEWAMGGTFLSITRTAEEVSIVCPQVQVSAEVKRQEGWRCLKVKGPLDLSLTGVLASLVVPLAREGISVFALSTYDTDYLLVKEEKLKTAIEILVKEGHEFKNSSE